MRQRRAARAFLRFPAAIAQYAAEERGAPGNLLYPVFLFLALNSWM